MKSKLIITIVVAILLIGFCTFDEIYVSGTFEDFSARLEVEEKKATFDFAELKALNEWWKSTHQKLEIIVPHAQLNEITFAFGELLGAVLADDLKSAEGQLHRLIQASEAMQEMFSLNLGNLL